MDLWDHPLKKRCTPLCVKFYKTFNFSQAVVQVLFSTNESTSGVSGGADIMNSSTVAPALFPEKKHDPDFTTTGKNMLNHAACKTRSLCLACSLQDVHQQIIIHRTLDRPPKHINKEHGRDNIYENVHRHFKSIRLWYLLLIIIVTNSQ